MAWFQLSFYSACLQHSTQLNVLIPDRAGLNGPCRTLYLLNGYRGDHTDWLLNTDVNGMTSVYNCAIVMPGGENSSYVDHPVSGVKYGEFVGKELVEFTRKVFPVLSHKREDTAISGLSMGGYGALRNGLKYADTFGYVMPLSFGMNGPEGVKDEQGKVRFEAKYGPLEAWDTSDNNPVYLAKTLLTSGKTLPQLYIACGYNDRLCEGNRKYHHELEAMGFPHVYEEGPGSHEWATWRWALPRALEMIGWKTDYQFVNPMYVEMKDEQYLAPIWKEAE